MFKHPRSHRRHTVVRWVSIGAMVAVCAPAVAQDYTAFRIEAENFTLRNSDWQVTTPSAVPADPVDSFHQNASGDSYMELLPDTRVTHDDQILQGQNFWGGPGQGPALHYNVNIAQPGRYLIYAKAYSTGTEDNGIHVGINSTTPESGHRLQWCEGKHTWTWSSAQRTDDAHCGVPKTIYLDIASAGQNTITFWAREDGFELDQFILLKEDHDGSLNCFPIANDSIRCEDATTAQLVSETYLPITVLDQGNAIDTPADSDGRVDLAISISATDEFTHPRQLVDYTVTIENQDVAETATGVTANVTIGNGLQFNESESCVMSGNNLSCSFAEIVAGQSASATFSASTTTTGTLFVNASLDADQPDDRVSNNSAQQSVVSNQPTHQIEGALASLTANTNIIANGSSVELTAEIANLGSDSLNGAGLAVSLPSGSSLQADQVSCNDDTLPCIVPVPVIDTTQRATVRFNISTANPASLVLPVTLQIEGDEQPENNHASLTIAATTAAARFISTEGVISFEAEQFTSTSPSSQTPADGYSTPAWNRGGEDSDASAQTYMIVLPDSRSTAAAPAVSGASNFSAGGEGPTLAYPVIFDRAGRYYIHARLRADSSENASVYVGLNNTWSSDNGAVIECDPSGQWQWTSSSGNCASPQVAYLDIESAGEHTVQISASTDGSRLDKLLLVTDAAFLASDTGPVPTVFSDAEADLALSAELSSDSVDVEEASVLTVSVANLSTDTTAVGINVQIEGIDPALADDISGFDTCLPATNGLSCQLSRLAPGAEQSAAIELMSMEEGNLPIALTLSALSTDSNDTNNRAALELKIATSGGGGLGLSALLLLLIGGLRVSAQVKKLLRHNDKLCRNHHTAKAVLPPTRSALHVHS